MSQAPNSFVTVVMPALNAEAWIADSLASLVAQTYPRELLDVVVVDDGSDDQTSAVASRALSDSRLTFSVLRNASPQGPSAARNRGWRHGRGQWIQFLDSDDLLDPNKIAEQMQAVEQHSTAAAFFSPWAHLVDDGNRWVADGPIKMARIGDDPLLDLIRSDNFLQIGSLLFARGWLERVGGFTEAHRLIEDVELLMRIVMDGGTLSPVLSNRALCWYRQRQDSLSRESIGKFIDGCVRNARMAERFWRERGVLTRERVDVLTDVYFFGTRYYAEHDRDSFKQVAANIHDLNPSFLPPHPVGLRLLTWLLGYPRAEQCAVQFRRAKRTIRAPRMAVQS